MQKEKQQGLPQLFPQRKDKGRTAKYPTPHTHSPTGWGLEPLGESMCNGSNSPALFRLGTQGQEGGYGKEL